MIILNAFKVVARAAIFFLAWFVGTFVVVFLVVGVSTQSPSTGTTVGLVGALVVYLVAYRRRPYGGCVQCNGKGKLWDWFGFYYRLCPRCGGSGRAWRAGLGPSGG